MPFLTQTEINLEQFGTHGKLSGVELLILMLIELLVLQDGLVTHLFVLIQSEL